MELSMMELSMMKLAAILFGSIGKIIDDIDDLNIIQFPFLKECLKNIHIMLFTILCSGDFTFSFISLSLALFGAGVDNIYWRSFIIVSFILSIMYYSHIENIKLVLLIIVIIVISTRVEEKIYTEEFSISKFISRIIGFAILCSLYFIPSKYYISAIFGDNYYIEVKNINYISKLLLIAIGGLGISVITQIYLLFIQ